MSVRPSVRTTETERTYVRYSDRNLVVGVANVSSPAKEYDKI